MVAGDLTLHGIKKTIQIPGSLLIAKEKLTVNSTFTIILSDYEVTIPALVADKISKTLDIHVNCAYKPRQ
jgi:polyisoprenoid-binding protein YceI